MAGVLSHRQIIESGGHNRAENPTFHWLPQKMPPIGLPIAVMVLFKVL
jgi:hypothetical protein